MLFLHLALSRFSFNYTVQFMSFSDHFAYLKVEFTLFKTNSHTHTHARTNMHSQHTCIQQIHSFLIINDFGIKAICRLSMSFDFFCCSRRVATHSHERIGDEFYQHWKKSSYFRRTCIKPTYKFKWIIQTYFSSDNTAECLRTHPILLSHKYDYFDV